MDEQKREAGRQALIPCCLINVSIWASLIGRTIRGSVRPISEAQIETLLRQPGIYAMFNNPNPNPNQRGRERHRETEREGDKERQRETKRAGEGEGEGEGKGKYLWQSLNCDRGHRAKGREIISEKRGREEKKRGRKGRRTPSSRSENKT